MFGCVSCARMLCSRRKCRCASARVQPGAQQLQRDDLRARRPRRARRGTRADEPPSPSSATSRNGPDRACRGAPRTQASSSRRRSIAATTGMSSSGARSTRGREQCARAARARPARARARMSRTRRARRSRARPALEQLAQRAAPALSGFRHAAENVNRLAVLPARQLSDAHGRPGTRARSASRDTTVRSLMPSCFGDALERQPGEVVQLDDAAPRAHPRAASASSARVELEREQRIDVDRAAAGRSARARFWSPPA